MAKQDFDKEDGVWRTVGGRRIFIRNGQSLSDAMKESGKFSRVAKNQELYKKTEKESKDIEEKLKDKEDKKTDSNNIEAKDLKEGTPYTINYGNGIEKTAIFIGKDEDGINRFYDGEGVEGNFGLSDKFLNENKMISENKDDDKFMELHNKLKGNNASGKEVDFREKVASDDTYKAVADYENGAKDYKETLDRFNGDKEKMTARFKEMGYVAPKGNEENNNKDIRIEDKNGELTGYTNGERVEYSHSGPTGLMASVYSTDEGKLSGQQFQIPKEYQGDKLQEYSLKEIDRLKSDKEAYETRQKEGLDKFIQKSTNPFYPDNEYSKEDLDRMAENGIKPMDNSYSGRGWKGVNSDKHLSTSEQAKAITNAMKEKYSDVKISRKSDVYSGGSSIDFNIMSSDKDMYISDADIDKLGGEQLFNTDITRGYGFERWANDNIDNYKTNHTYSVDDVKKYAKETLNNIKNHENQNVRGNEWYLSDYGKKVVSDLNKEANSYTYDDSDSMTDYFNHGTYMNISIGKWNKPYEVNQKTTNGTMNSILQQKAYQKYLKEHPNSEMKFEDFMKSKK